MRRAFLKVELRDRIAELLSTQGATVKKAELIGPKNDLPCDIELGLAEGMDRRYRVFVWSVAHGGKSRAQGEYRIQTKLKAERRLSVQEGTLLLLGYYDEAIDIAGRECGNSPPLGMKVFVAWNPVNHLRVGKSSSCQVSFDILLEAHLHGVAVAERTLSGGLTECVFAFRPSRLLRYFDQAAGGHDLVTSTKLSRGT
jgi:hypothetical protein